MDRGPLAPQAGHDRDALLLFVLFLVRWLQIGWEKDERPWRLVGFGLVRWCAAGACGHVLGVVVCVVCTPHQPTNYREAPGTQQKLAGPGGWGLDLNRP